MSLFSSRSNTDDPGVGAEPPHDFVALLQTADYRAELTKDSGGDPLIRSSTQGVRFSIWFYSFNDIPSRSLQFFLGLGMNGRGNLANINAWNMEHRWARAALDKDGDPELRMDVAYGTGMSARTFIFLLERWDRLVGQFLMHVGWNS